MEETCKFASDDVLVADPNSCQRYGVCKDGKLNHIEYCAEGNYFNARYGECQFDAEDTCLPTVANICKKVSVPTTKADPNDCNKSCHCRGDGTYECSQCPKNQYFDPKQGLCVESSDYYCRADSICRLVRNKMFLGDPDRCGYYVQCMNSVETLASCRLNEFYHPQPGHCRSNNPCSGSALSTAGPGVLEPLPTRPEICELWHMPYFPYLMDDRVTCVGYYLCNDITGPGTWHKCPLGTHFDIRVQKCITPNAAACVRDRCANLDQPFVSDYGSKCAAYLYCKNQTNQPDSGGRCASVNKKYPYFNEVLGGCTDVLPDFPICW